MNQKFLTLLILCSFAFVANCQNIQKICKPDVFNYEKRIYVNSFIKINGLKSILIEDSRKLIMNENFNLKVDDENVNVQFKNQVIKYNNLIKPFIEGNFIKNLIKSGKSEQLDELKYALDDVRFFFNKNIFKVHQKDQWKVKEMVEIVDDSQTKFNYLGSFIDHELWDSILPQDQLKNILKELNLDEETKIPVFKTSLNYYYKKIIMINDFNYLNNSNLNGTLEFSLFIPLYDRDYQLGSDPTDCESSHPNLPLFFRKKGQN